MTEIIIRDGIVSSLTTQPTIAWDASRNGDNPYEVFNGSNYMTWNDFSKSTSYNIVSYFDQYRAMELPIYKKWKSSFNDISSIPWPLYALDYVVTLKYNGDNILFNSNNYGFGCVIQLPLKTDSVSNSGFTVFSLLRTFGNSNDSPTWVPISLDYDLASISPLTHRFRFRCGKEYATITINASNFDITKPHVYSVSGTPNSSNLVYLYIDNQLVATLTNTSISSGNGWTSINSAIPNSFFIGGRVGINLPQVSFTFMGVYAVFFYEDSYNYSEIFDLCKYRYNVPDVTFVASVVYTTLLPANVSVFGSTQFSASYVSIL